MPMARMALYEQGVSIYLAPTTDSRPEWQNTIKHIAIEGRCYVINCNQYVTKSMYPHNLNCYSDLENVPENMCPDGSCIIDLFG